MDDNTAAVLTQLIQLGGIASVFWALAFSMKWQGLKDPLRSLEGDTNKEADDDEDDDEDEDGDDDDEESDTASAKHKRNIELAYWLYIGTIGGMALGFLLGVAVMKAPCILCWVE